jgi:hypothetical protein
MIQRFVLKDQILLWHELSNPASRNNDLASICQTAGLGGLPRPNLASVRTFPISSTFDATTCSAVDISWRIVQFAIGKTWLRPWRERETPLGSSTKSTSWKGLNWRFASGAERRGKGRGDADSMLAMARLGLTPFIWTPGACITNPFDQNLCARLHLPRYCYRLFLRIGNNAGAF